MDSATIWLLVETIYVPLTQFLWTLPMLEG